ncbi:MAG: multicopper oxidase domain-containing protein, partial [Actinomycetota bacterium]|nr:multicopper oxidase domain-containing protein [Actinomycetota bacterium]
MSTYTPHRPAQLRRWTPAIGLAALVATATFADISVAAPATGRHASAATAAPAVISSHSATSPVVAPSQVAAPARPAASLSFDLCATTGTAVLPNANTSGSLTTSVPIWSYVTGDCITGTGAGNASLGGAPTLVVSQGDVVTVRLHNDLAEASALTFKGQLLPSDTDGAAPGGSKTYTFDAASPGTYLYQAGVAGVFERQVAMGLWGVLVVLPAAAGQAYEGASTAFDASMTVTISEIDPALNAAPTTYDMRNFAPKYTLYNGEPYPGTGIMGTANAGDDLLVRYVNAGLSYHSLSVLGANQRIIADDGNALAFDYSVVAQTVGPGQTTDAIIAVPAATPDGGLLTLFDGALKLHNRNRRPMSNTSYRMYGGAVGFVQVSGTPGGSDVVGPVTASVSADGVTGAVAASISDVAQGGSNVVAAEFFIDSVGAAGTGSGMTATDTVFDSPSEAVEATI